MKRYLTAFLAVLLAAFALSVSAFATEVSEEDVIFETEVVEELVVSAPAVNATTGTCGQNLTWTLDADNTLTISGVGAMGDYGYGEAPWNLYRYKIQKVVVEQGVTTIGKYAFCECRNLESVTLPSGLTSIGMDAFCECVKLNDITLPDSVTNIAAYAFTNCSSLGSIVLPKNLTGISDYVFNGCSGLTEITIFDGVEMIGMSAFRNCSSLTDITLPDSVTGINLSAFKGCSGLTSITLSKGLQQIYSEAFHSCSSLTDITIPDGVTQIGTNAFEGCTKLANVTIGKGVTSIGSYAFRNCSSLNEIVFGGNAPTIDRNVFKNVTATAYYPANDATWTDEVKQNYGGEITWVATETVILGDLDNNGSVDDEDVIYLLWHTLMQDEYPVEQDVDFDHNGSVDDEDVIYLLWHTLMPNEYPLDGEFQHSEYFIPGVSVEDVILWFNEVCLDAEYVTGGNPSVVQKWRVPIRYWIYGTPTQADLETLDAFVAQINNIEGFPGMVKADYAAMANLKIHFVNQQGLVNIMGNSYWGHDGAVTFWYDENNVIYKETICVRTDLSQYVRNSVLQEEIYNGLGPIQDTLLRPDSLIYQNYAEPQSMTQVDELLLKLLYHPDIQWGMDAQECEAVIRNLYY